ncbi:hypothetical protein GCM10022265_22840 [Marinobacter xestospongiae]
MTAVGYGGTFTAFTYLTPILEHVTGFASGVVSILLLIYGVSVATGNIWGGKLADRLGPTSALYIIFGGLAAILFALTFSAYNPIAAVITLLVWGGFAFGNVPGLQVYVVQLAERYTPHSVDVASGLNIAAFNIGIAGGAWLGGHVVEGMSLMNTPWIGGIIVLSALLLTRISTSLDNRQTATA